MSEPVLREVEKWGIKNFRPYPYRLVGWFILYGVCVSICLFIFLFVCPCVCILERIIVSVTRCCLLANGNISRIWFNLFSHTRFILFFWLFNKLKIYLLIIKTPFYSYQYYINAFILWIFIYIFFFYEWFTSVNARSPFSKYIFPDFLSTQVLKHEVFRTAAAFKVSTRNLKKSIRLFKGGEFHFVR